MAARRWLVGLIAFAGAALAACGGEGESDRGSERGNDDDSDDSEDDDVESSPEDSTADRDAGRGGKDSGATRSNDAGRPSGTSRDASAVVPGTMPPAPEGTGTTSRDAGSSTRVDGSTPTTKPATDISSCTPPPAGTPANAVKAWMMLNELRLPAGAGCINTVPELLKSAQLHCEYKQMNKGNASCTADAHTQIMGCPGFTGANVQAREIAAGYPRNLAYTEVALTYGDNPTLAIPGWLVTPFHRIPMIDPWTTDMGWGGGPGCDIIDFGRGTVTPPADTVVVFPYDGQTEVPVSFNGLEAPQPPPPAGGWPSSYPVSIYAQKLKITEHILTKEGSDTPLEHTWLDTMNPGNAGLRPYFGNTAMLYGAPFEPDTTYTVKLVGTYVGGELNRTLSFKTSAKKPGRF